MTETTSFKTSADAIASEFAERRDHLSKHPDIKAVDDLRIHFLGKKGKITTLLESLRNVSKEQRPEAGKIVNTLRQGIEKAIEELQQGAKSASLQAKLQATSLDITLPVNDTRGSLHPVTLMRQQLLREFRHLGFTVIDGPEIELDFYNFEALNFPLHHPARDMQDTFFIKEWDGHILRTHTSNIQVHAMLSEKPPMRIVAPGRVFRCDSDITHTPMFHQIEAFVVDEGISFSHLKGTIDRFLKAIYGHDLKTRFRPSFFPFVEPGAEIDLQCTACRGGGCRICKSTGWLEIGGSGMIHPNVFEAVGIDSETYTGFAFGFGIDRMAMLKYGLSDLRQLFEGQVSFLHQFPVFT